MSKLPEIVSKAWDEKISPVIFTTVDKDGIPNSIYATCVSKYDEETLVVADNYFDKTKKNILSGSTGSILFITEENKAYQTKGKLTYHIDGPIFDDMKAWNPEKHPGHAAVSLHIEEVFKGAEKLV